MPHRGLRPTMPQLVRANAESWARIEHSTMRGCRLRATYSLPVETNWVQVVVALGIVIVGLFVLLNGERLSSTLRSMAESRGRPALREREPAAARGVGALFIVVGIAAGVFGLFFADKM